MRIPSGLINPLRAASSVAKVFGISDPSLEAGARATATVESRANRSLSALPHFTGSKRPAGATRAMKTPGALSVIGSPSMKVLHSQGGGAKTVLRRTMTNFEFLTDEDFKSLEKLIAKIEAMAKRLSNGGLSYSDLARMGHPYGKGRRAGLGRLRGAGRGVSNMAIANRHTGKYRDSWKGVLKKEESGVSFLLENDAEYSAFLAFGTKRMRAHGPQTTAVAKYLAEIDAEWRKLARLAKSRANAQAQVTAGRSAMAQGA